MSSLIHDAPAAELAPPRHAVGLAALRLDGAIGWTVESLAALLVLVEIGVSSQALLALAPQALDWLGRPSPGVALCRIVSDAPWLAGLEVMLKGGQMGDEGLFETLVRGTG